MPIVKNSFERHKVLDRCFRDKSKNTSWQTWYGL